MWGVGVRRQRPRVEGQVYLLLEQVSDLLLASARGGAVWARAGETRAFPVLALEHCACRRAVRAPRLPYAGAPRAFPPVPLAVSLPHRVPPGVLPPFFARTPGNASVSGLSRRLC